MNKTAILLSGGIDSLVAAHLLKEQGVEIIGIHFITGYEKKNQDEDASITGRDETGDSLFREISSGIVKPLSDSLKIPVKILDCRRAFQKHVVDYFIQTYRQGKTPSPCLVCNPAVKFDTALAYARNLGADHLATGHYACIQRDDSGAYRLFRGRDPGKDQSYFLARLDQKALAAAVFPLCRIHKAETVRYATANRLQPVRPHESQDICFIKEGHYGAFLAAQPGFEAGPGVIEDTRGNIIGRHPGLHFFTIGQRRGINCPAAEPYYVVKIDTRQNKLVVGFKQETYSQTCVVENINWIRRPPDSPLHADTRIRYRHRAAPSTIVPSDVKSAVVKFNTPQEAVTPGQAAVFYDGDEVLGGGWISGSNSQKK